MNSATLTRSMVYDDLALIKLRRQREMSIIFEFRKLTFIQLLTFDISFGSILHE